MEEEEKEKRKEKKRGEGSRNPGPSEFWAELVRLGFGPSWFWAELVLGRLGLGRVALELTRWGRKRLPKFKFSAKFPIGLHVILQIQIKKFENDCYIM